MARLSLVVLAAASLVHLRAEELLDKDLGEGLSVDDACASGEGGKEECEISLRQLRGERREPDLGALEVEEAPQFNYNWNFGCAGNDKQEKPATDGAQFNMNWNFCFDDKTVDEAAKAGGAGGGFDMGSLMKKKPGNCKSFGCAASFDFMTLMNECQCFPGCNATFVGNICCPDFEENCQNSPTKAPLPSTATPEEKADLKKYTTYANAECSSLHGAVELKTTSGSLAACAKACKKDSSCEGFAHGGGQCKMLEGINIPACAASDGVWSTYVKNAGQKPPKCSAYMAKTGCSWTKKFSCPGQKKGSKGKAKDDGTEGFNCCCNLGMWKSNRPALPTGSKLRIINKYTNRALFAKKGHNWEDGVGAGTPPEKVTDDGYWTLIPQGKNKYRIVNQYSKRALYAKKGENWESGWGAGSPPSKVTRDGLWKLEHDDTGGFRIINVKSKRALYAKTGGAGEMSWSGGVGVGSPPNKVTKDGVWVLDFVK